MTDECYKGVIIYNNSIKIWTTGVGGSGAQGYNTVQQAKEYIDDVIGMGYSFTQCGTETNNALLIVAGLAIAYLALKGKLK